MEKNNDSSKWAPVVMFVYNRLGVTRRTIKSLQGNEGANETILYIYSDGGKDTRSWKQVKRLRKYLVTVNGFKEVHVIERKVNYYIERNVVEGVTEIVRKHGKVIILEDDILTSPYFLSYMNEALKVYATYPKVMHIAGFTPLWLEGGDDIYFTSHMAGYGAWATWKDRWDRFQFYNTPEQALEGLSNKDRQILEYGGEFPCLKFLYKNPIPWDICWYISIYKNAGLCLSPARTLVKNIGLQNGTHFGFRNSRLWGKFCFDRAYYPQKIKINPLQEIRKDERIERQYREVYRNFGMRYNWLGKIVRFLYLKFCKKR